MQDLVELDLALEAGAFSGGRRDKNRLDLAPKRLGLQL